MIASTLSRSIGMKLLNQGIGGYSHRRGFLQRKEFTPDLIIVALRTNDVGFPEAEHRDVKGFYDELNALKDFPF